MQDFLLQETLFDTSLKLLWASKAVTHCREANIKCKTDHELAVAHVATTLDNVLWSDLEGSWVVNLLEITCEVALVVVFPLDQTANLVSKLRVADVAARLVHGTLVASLECRCLRVVEKTAALVASLMLHLAADDVQDESVARDLLVRLDLDDVASLYTAPITDLEALVPLGEDELFYRLTVDFLSCLLQFLVME